MNEECEHNDYEMVGKFPENMYVEGECMANDIKCLECGAIGHEYYSFNDREWDEDGATLDE